MKKELQWTEWFDKAKSVKTTDDFNELVNYLFKGDICHTYDSSVHAVSALAIAGAWLGAHIEGITGFQAGHIKFDFMHEWDGIGKEVGLQVVDFDHYLCYPQYVKQCPIKKISLETWKRVQRVCADKLNSLDVTEVHGDWRHTNQACYSVRQYWADVCNGIIPDCLMVVDEPEYSRGVGYSRIDPICVSRPAHTLADKERGYNDAGTPWYDKDRVMKEREEYIKKLQEESVCCAG